jgi:hypothetical protein
MILELSQFKLIWYDINLFTKIYGQLEIGLIFPLFLINLKKKFVKKKIYINDILGVHGVWSFDNWTSAFSKFQVFF